MIYVIKRIFFTSNTIAFFKFIREGLTLITYKSQRYFIAIFYPRRKRHIELKNSIAMPIHIMFNGFSDIRKYIFAESYSSILLINLNVSSCT